MVHKTTSNWGAPPCMKPHEKPPKNPMKHPREIKQCHKPPSFLGMVSLYHLQGGAPKIAKLVYKCNNYGL